MEIAREPVQFTFAFTANSDLTWTTFSLPERESVASEVVDLKPRRSRRTRVVAYACFVNKTCYWLGPADLPPSTYFLVRLPQPELFQHKVPLFETRRFNCAIFGFVFLLSFSFFLSTFLSFVDDSACLRLFRVFSFAIAFSLIGVLSMSTSGSREKLLHGERYFVRILPTRRYRYKWSNRMIA